MEFETPDEERDDACLTDVAGASVDSMVSAVRDVLPELGRGFVELCLEQFNHDVETVINALLEDQLPAHLQASVHQLTVAALTEIPISGSSISQCAVHSGSGQRSRNPGLLATRYRIEQPKKIWLNLNF